MKPGCGLPCGSAVEQPVLVRNPVRLLAAGANWAEWRHFSALRPLLVLSAAPAKSPTASPPDLFQIPPRRVSGGE
ncbi:MAG: hypothetical protein FJ392_13715 [Verrucomicrobia bacterium]|nr:hypothetical protein [Verrucomicrobiota bacterium]